jgi:Na+/proline symporter
MCAIVIQPEILAKNASAFGDRILMSDIALNWGPLDIAAIALIIGSPGLVPGVIVGALAWRRHRVTGALLGAVAGFALWLCGFVLWKMSPWS